MVTWSHALEGRDPEPSAVVIDSQSARTTESGGLHGFDATKKVKCRKALVSEIETHHIATDTCGRLIEAQVTPANVQDSHFVVPLVKALARLYLALRLAFVDQAYRGQKLLGAVADPISWTIEIITRSQRVGHFVSEPRLWGGRADLCLLGRNRRLAKDYEASIASQEALLNLAFIKALSRQVARQL